MSRLLIGVLVIVLIRGNLATRRGDDQLRAAGWKRHTIDAGSRGADGVRLLDINRDGRVDLVTGWEEGGQVRAYVQPGIDRVRQPWPQVIVGRVTSPEDAVFADLDADGAADVVSCCEGKTRSVYVHWGPGSADELLNAEAWRTESFPHLQDQAAWMFSLPMQLDGRHGVDLVLGAKGAGAEVGWLESPGNPRDLAAWRWHPLCQAGWIMSLLTRDMDGDGDRDILLTDRKGAHRGCRWLENPGVLATRSGADWKNHFVGGREAEVMFCVSTDIDGDGGEDVVAATSREGIYWWRRVDGTGRNWQATVIPMPPDCGSGKGVFACDLNGDGRVDLAVTCEKSKGKHGVFWLEAPVDRRAGEWRFHPIGGREQGVKFDLIQMLDLDDDGDVDLLTCEERDQLGVVWYENPQRTRTWLEK